MKKLGKIINGVYFSPRELECAELLIKGATVSKIAEQLMLSPRTIEFYLNNMKAKVGCKTKTELIEFLLL